MHRQQTLPAPRASSPNIESTICQFGEEDNPGLFESVIIRVSKATSTINMQDGQRRREDSTLYFPREYLGQQTDPFAPGFRMPSSPLEITLDQPLLPHSHPTGGSWKPIVQSGIPFGAPQFIRASAEFISPEEAPLAWRPCNVAGTSMVAEPVVPQTLTTNYIDSIIQLPSLQFKPIPQSRSIFTDPNISLSY
ncbi:uncharacterized protein BP5553_02846 [Venustampulla echinocandica]|uniref:Uncharacterized protein n=1 Tax=Venustampulla echinocandica TaxID=2656787 RepID=A0A370TSK0_9HELO|nr:uncharacterized protein BP5553_02846 [Venustampulla echinocandica]RDL38506.1 hypothetical protein BP5553_02846 [Venustampulla echinocandica]